MSAKRALGAVVLTASVVAVLAALVPVANADGPLVMPTVAADAGDAPPLVVATTSVIADVVHQVAGDRVRLEVLVPAGSDPHGFRPAARQLAGVTRAAIVFENGWGLEEGLLEPLAVAAKDAVRVPVSAGITPRTLDNDVSGHIRGHDHDHAVDPHVWLSVDNVRQWTRNIRDVLTALRPHDADTFRRRADSYLKTLDALDADIRSTLASIAPDRRRLVTRHHALGYFAEAFDFEIVGSLIPSMSAAAEPSAAGLGRVVTAMRTHGLCTVFGDFRAPERLAQAVAGELSHCQRVSVLALHTGSLGPSGSGADSYVGMMRTNASILLEGLGSR